MSGRPGKAAAQAKRETAGATKTPGAADDGRAVTGETYQAVAHVMCESTLEVMRDAHRVMPPNSDGSKDAGPVCQGVLSGWLQFLVLDGHLSDADIRTRMAAVADEILPQLRMALRAAAHGAHEGRA